MNCNWLNRIAVYGNVQRRWMSMKKKKKPGTEVAPKKKSNMGSVRGGEGLIDRIMTKTYTVPKQLSEEETAQREEAAKEYGIQMFRFKRKQQRLRHRLVQSRMLAYYELPESRRPEADKRDLLINPLIFYQRVETPPVEGYSHQLKGRFHEKEMRRRELEDQAKDAAASSAKSASSKDTKKHHRKHDGKNDRVKDRKDKQLDKSKRGTS